MGDDIAFGNDKKYPQLQAADLLVWETSKEQIDLDRKIKPALPQIMKTLNRKKNLAIAKPT